MKILLINVVYGKGSTGNITKTLFDEYTKLGNDTYAIYGRGKYPKDNNNKHIYKLTYELESKIHHAFSNVFGNTYGAMYVSTHRIIKKIKNINPDVVHLHCLNGYFVNVYTLLSFLAASKIKTILTMHADFMMTGGCGYSLECKKYLACECKDCPRKKEFKTSNKLYKKMESTINKFDKDYIRITCVSPWLTKRYKESPIYNKYQVTSILNPVDDIFFGNIDKLSYPYKHKKNVLYVTSNINEIEKGGQYLPIIAKECTDIHFTVIGASDTDNVTKLDNVSYIGKVNQKELAIYYKFANATIILSLRETFGMSVAESLVSGTPVIGFNNGGSESIAINDFSYFFDQKEISTFISKLKEITETNLNKNNISNLAISKYNKKIISKEYLKLFD